MAPAGSKGSKLAPLYAAAAALVGGGAHAGVLPDDRADLLYHSYQADGLTVNGLSLMGRKKIGEHVSLLGNIYSDSITGASIDVVTQASPYKEKRLQEQLGVDLLAGKATYSVGFINGSETDYRSRTAYASVSEDMFGDLTTVSLGVTRGWDKVGERGQAIAAFKDADRRNWQLGLTQVLTRNLLASLNYEASESEGFLNNPYRKIRYLSASSNNGLGYDTDVEKYPHTRTGNAVSGQLKYYLRWRAALDGSYRFYSDTWGIRAQTAELGYTLPAFRRWTFDAHARYYRQNAASFYADLFPYQDAQNFMARDRELAAFKSLDLGFGASWEWRLQQKHWLQRASLNARFDRIHYRYDDFRDLRVHALTPGTEPLYKLDANVVQLYISAWF
jgi:hypothetical protein